MASWTNFYFNDDLRRTEQSTWKRAQTPTESNTYREGDIVEVWDHVFRWEKSCVSYALMKKWQERGDILADNALSDIQGTAGKAGGTDLFARLEAAANDASASPAVSELWKSLHKQGLPNWPDQAQLERGRAVFFRYASMILASLLHWSLSGGFSSPEISRVLNLASYLCPPMSSSPEGQPPCISKESNDRSFMRLLETTQFVINCMAHNATAVGGVGWQSIIRVRLLHATMRNRLLTKSRQEWKSEGFHPFDERVQGNPINQRDIAFTLVSFSTSSMHCLRKVGITPTQQECDDWTALWRVIGYYLGVDLDILNKHHTTYRQSECLLASSILNILPGESYPPPSCQFPMEENLVRKQDQVIHIKHPEVKEDPYTTPPTLPVLLCICNRWAIPFDFPAHCAAARQLLGPTLSDWLSVPRTGWFDTLTLRVGILAALIPPGFARVYTARWDEKRRSAMEKSVTGAVAVELGLRATKFRPRAPGDFRPAKEGDEFFGEPRFEDVRSSLYLWSTLYAEMAVVVVISTVLFVLFAPVTIPLTLGWWMFF